MPRFADRFVGSEPFECPKPASEIVGGDKVAEVLPKLCVAVVMVAFDGGFLDGPVHPFDLAVGPRVLHPDQAVLDAILVADAIEDVVEGVFVMGVIGELDTVVGQHGVDGVGHGCDQVAQELRRNHLATFLVQLDERELAGAVNRHEHT